MSRQLEAIQERRSVVRQKNIVLAVEFALQDVVESQGGVFLGFAFMDRGSDCLLVLKADWGGEKQVSFVGSEDLGSCLIKAVKLGTAEKLVWKADEYRR